MFTKLIKLPAQRLFPVPAAKLYVKLAAPALVWENAVTVLNPVGAIAPIVAPPKFVSAFVVVVLITGVKASPEVVSVKVPVVAVGSSTTIDTNLI